MSETTFEVPEGTAQEAKESMVDALAADTKAADEPPEYPEGAPKFYWVMRAPYRQRAEGARRYRAVQDFLKAHPELTKAVEVDESDEDAEVDWDRAANSWELMALLDEALESLAVDPAAYRAWDARMDSDVLQQTWSAYQAAAQPGEASSSSS